VLVCTLLAAVFAAPTPAHAGIEVSVGYSGGPYYVKDNYSDAEIAGMSDGRIYEYSAMDEGGFMRKGFGRGIHVDVLFAAADVDPYGLSHFYFLTLDQYLSNNWGTGYAYWTYSTLSEPRSYYSELPQHFNFSRKQAERGIFASELDAVLDSAVSVPAILASSSSYARVDSADDPRWNDASLMSTSSKYRLLFGQAHPAEVDSRFAAHDVHGMVCILGGKPEIVFDQVDVEGEVGTTITIKPSLLANDELVASEGVKDITWESSDPTVATFTKNGDGSITVTIVGEGEANIGGTFGKDPAYQAVASIGVNKTGTGTGLNGGGPGGGGPDDNAPADPGVPNGTGGTDVMEREGEGTALPAGSDLRPVDSGEKPADATVPVQSDSLEGIEDSPTPLSANFAEPSPGEAGALGGEAAWQLSIKTDEEKELEDEEAQESLLQLLSFDENSGLVYGVGFGGLLFLGSLYRVGRYELLRDPYQGRPRPSARDRKGGRPARIAGVSLVMWEKV
jgi:hypothetical protein